MAERLPLTYKDADVELESLADPQDFEDPDSPLPLLHDDDDDDDNDNDHANTNRQTALGRLTCSNIMRNTPKWMRTAQPRGRSAWHNVFDALKPRLTWRYVVSALVVLYVFYCIIFQSPLFASNLPAYTGPFEVGAIDVEVPVRTPRKTSDWVLASNGKPAFELETVLFTLYYPAAQDAKSDNHHPWVPKPVSLTAEGYARAAHFNNFISRPVFTFALWAIAGSIKIPAMVDVPLMHKDKDGKPDRNTVVIFSHGQASSRTDYTHYCGELASRGIIVAAIEHRDGSAPGSIVTSKEGKERRVMYLNKNDLQNGKDMDDDAFKFEQLAFRQAEIEETVAVLKSLHAGKGATVFADNARKEGRDLTGWEDRLNFTQIIIAGHSLGATGALQALRGAPSAKNPAVGGVIFDPGKSSGRLNTDIDVPVLIINSDSWSKKVTVFFGRPHFDTVKEIAQDVLKRIGASWFLTSMRTSHPSVTDAPLIEPWLLRWTTGATIDAVQGVDTYIHPTAKFLSFVSTGKRSSVLALGVTHEEYGKDIRTDSEKKGFSQDLVRYWQVHVAPQPEIE
ncbi:Platelet-activating factor acetylhydrolase 2, cytoplasmic [Colletotrichum chlorophyti]|uniref:Putative phospholipase n=1 Tax=Colletotrichum chlorophyti TaxID=708187 RepID=A0A1Q8RC42_9PEZI|nr:Platelet-activating factor acetylhydrolase 2, cytoplasmic [Colletotrichum chlorophyti]